MGKQPILLLGSVLALGIVVAGIVSFATADITAPVISGITVSDITETSVTISWITDELATSNIAYRPDGVHAGLSSPVVRVTTDTTVDKTSHSLNLDGLSSGVTYFFQVISRDASGNEAISDEQTFTTIDTTPPSISDVSVTEITDTSASINCTFDEPAEVTYFEYGLTSSYGNGWSPINLMGTLPLGASIILDGLEPDTTYHFKLKLEDASGNETISDDQTFTTIDTVPIYTYQIVNKYPHDISAFTQGLVFEDGVIYEGTGLYGESSLRKVELETGDVLQLHQLPAQYFGEGVTVFKDSIVQLTWKSNLGFVYDKSSLELLSDFSYSTKGWGITNDGERFIMSDGTSNLYFLEPETFSIIDHINVYNNDIPVNYINELEYINGQIYANILPTDNIAIINPYNGQVSGWVDLSGLLQSQDYNMPANVLNGIAYDTLNNRLFVTGKLWPWLFEIELVVKE